MGAAWMQLDSCELWSTPFKQLVNALYVHRVRSSWVASESNNREQGSLGEFDGFDERKRMRASCRSRRPRSNLHWASGIGQFYGKSNRVGQKLKRRQVRSTIELNETRRSSGGRSRCRSKTLPKLQHKDTPCCPRGSKSSLVI